MTFLGQVKAGLLNDIVYVVGGRVSVTGDARALVQAYNVSTNSWSLRKSLPSPRRAINGVSAINGKLYVTGGFNSSSALTRTLYVYTPGTNSWVKRADMPHVGYS